MYVVLGNIILFKKFQFRYVEVLVENTERQTRIMSTGGVVYLEHLNLCKRQVSPSTNRDQTLQRRHNISDILCTKHVSSNTKIRVTLIKKKEQERRIKVVIEETEESTIPGTSGKGV